MSFKQDKFIFFIIFISLIPIIFLGLAFSLRSKGERRPLIVMVDGKEFNDEEFDERFNYQSLVNKTVYFDEPLNYSEFIYSREMKYLNFSSLDEVWSLLEELRTPRVVIGFARWLSNGTYEESVRRYLGRDNGRPGEPDYIEEIGMTFGASKWKRIDYNKVFYDVYRNPIYLRVVKGYITYGSGGDIWALNINIYVFPPYTAEFYRDPLHARRY